MPRGLKKVSKVDLFLSHVAEKVLTDFFNGSKTSLVVIPTYFTLGEVQEIVKGAKSFKHMVYTKEEGVKNITTYSVSIKIVSEAFNLVVVSK